MNDAQLPTLIHACDVFHINPLFHSFPNPRAPLAITCPSITYMLLGKGRQHTFSFIVYVSDSHCRQQLIKSPGGKNFWCHNRPEHQLQSSEEPVERARRNIWMNRSPCAYNSGRKATHYDIMQASLRTLTIHTVRWFFSMNSNGGRHSCWKLHDKLVGE